MLTGFLSDFAVKLLTWLYGKVSNELTKALEYQRKVKASREKNAQVREQTEQAETKQERIDALNNDADSF